jgi:hypothetical protein
MSKPWPPRRRPPEPPTHVRLTLKRKGKKMVFDPVLRWTKSPSPNVEQYGVAWLLNGSAVGTIMIPQSAAMDTSGYSTDFAAANPTVTLAGGDTVSASVAAMDVTDSLNSAPVSAGPLTIPTVPTVPQPPVNVTLTLT